MGSASLWARIILPPSAPELVHVPRTDVFASVRTHKITRDHHMGFTLVVVYSSQLEAKIESEQNHQILAPLRLVSRRTHLAGLGQFF